MITVYLCGSIGTVNIEEHLSWRERVSGACDVANSDCAPTNLTFLVRDPLRYQNPASFTDGGLHDAKVPDSFFVAMDVADVRRADVLFVVFWKQERQSVGTFMEMGMAAGLGKPMILVTDDPQVADHPFVNRFVSIVCKSVDEGIAWLKKMA
jgi:hypothetical protein